MCRMSEADAVHEAGACAWQGTHSSAQASGHARAVRGTGLGYPGNVAMRGQCTTVTAEVMVQVVCVRKALA